MNDSSDPAASETSASSPLRAQAARPEPVPLVIGVTGHRDLVESEIPELEKRIRGFLLTMQGRFGHLFQPQRDKTLLAQLQAKVDDYWAEVAATAGG